ncbi:MAG: DUF3284 domain-containing protein [Erysipelotrichaceae bacterium]|nr:DUF3284 domain-containing protein [Erysipelotrichaceae bacterium]
MFTYKKELNVRTKEIYDLLLEQIAYEASEKSGRTIGINDIGKGCRYNYKRKNGKNEITAYVDVKKPSPEKIETIYEMQGIKYVFAYGIKAIGEEKCELSYSQEGGQSSVLSDFFMKRSMSKRFATFENTILQRRKQKNKDTSE